MKNSYTLLLVVILIIFAECEIPSLTGSADSARVIAFSSKVLNHDSYFLVTVPHKNKDSYPVLYVLQGAGADPYGWAYLLNLQKMADKYNMIIVSAGAGYDPWSNPYVGGMVDYIMEIVAIVDQNYTTVPSRTHRAISGLSLGGFGALRIAATYPDYFGSVSAMSGGFNSGPNAPIDNLGKLNLMFDCGTADELYPGNKTLHNYLTEIGVSHTFNSYSGGHNTYYFEEHAESHIKFHNEFFDRSR